MSSALFANLKTISATGLTDANDVIRDYEAKGWEKLGNGCFGAAMSHAKKTGILKVFVYHDEGYLAFLDMIAENQDCPHFPQLLGPLRKHVNESGNIVAYSIRMEKLDSAYGENYRFRCAMNLGRTAVSMISGLAETGSEIRAMRLLRQTMISQGLQDDLHGGNVMKRGATVVITDPYVKVRPQAPFIDSNRNETDPAWHGSFCECSDCCGPAYNCHYCYDDYDAKCRECQGHSTWCEKSRPRPSCTGCRENHGFFTLLQTRDINNRLGHDSRCETVHPEFEPCGFCAMRYRTGLFTFANAKGV